MANTLNSKLVLNKFLVLTNTRDILYTRYFLCNNGYKYNDHYYNLKLIDDFILSNIIKDMLNFLPSTIKDSDVINITGISRLKYIPKYLETSEEFKIIRTKNL